MPHDSSARGGASACARGAELGAGAVSRLSRPTCVRGSAGLSGPRCANLSPSTRADVSPSPSPSLPWLAFQPHHMRNPGRRRRPNVVASSGRSPQAVAAAGDTRLQPTGWRITTRIAADAWNRTGITPRIVFVSRRQDAGVRRGPSRVGVSGRNLGCSHAEGSAVHPMREHPCRRSLGALPRGDNHARVA
jgi:hypothetical protein